MLGLFWVFILPAMCQTTKYNTDANWCLGDSVKLTHTTYPPTQGTSKSLFTYTDLTLNKEHSLFLYYRGKWNTTQQDSISLIDENNFKIMNSDSLKGITAKKSAVTVSFNEIVYIVTYHVVNSLDTSLYLHSIQTAPNLKVLEKNVRIIKKPLTTSVSACKHANGKDWWILSHGLGNNKFYRILIANNGIQQIDSQSIGPVFPWVSIAGTSSLIFNRQGSKLAAICREGKLNFYDFDRCTGLLSNNIDKGFTPTVTTFSGFKFMYLDGEYSRAGDLFYLVRLDTLYQYDKVYNRRICWYDTLDLPEKSVVAIKYNYENNVMYSVNATNGSQTYIPTDKDFRMGIIEHPDSLGAACRYKHGALYLNGRRAPGGFGPTVNYNLGALGTAYAWPANDLKDGPPPLCAGDSVRLGEWFSEPGISYQWAPAAGLSCTTCFAPKAAPAQTTTYTLYTTSTNACGLTADTATVTVTVLQPPSQVVVNLGSDRTICAGDSLTIGVQPVPNVVYSWNTDATTASIGIRPEQTTTYILQAVDTSAGCGEPVPAIDTLTVTVLPRNVLGVSLPPDTAICPGAGLTLSPVLTGTGSVLWSTGATTLSITVEPSQTTTYTLTYSGTACDTPDTATVTVIVLPPDASPCRTARPDETTAQIRIYPNPTTGPLTVELPAGIRTDIDLLNAIGQGLLRVVNRSGTVHLDLTPYPDGHYYLTVKGQRTRVVLRK
jgi:hypothetical protein